MKNYLKNWVNTVIAGIKDDWAIINGASRDTKMENLYLVIAFVIGCVIAAVMVNTSPINTNRSIVENVIMVSHDGISDTLHDGETIAFDGTITVKPGQISKPRPKPTPCWGK